MNLLNKIMSANYRNKLSLLRKLASKVIVKDFIPMVADEEMIKNQLTEIK